MAAVRTPAERTLNRLAIVSVLVVTLIFLAPIYWITATAFKPRNLATTVPPTVMFEPEVSPFVKLFLRRSQLRQPPVRPYHLENENRGSRVAACSRGRSD